MHTTIHYARKGQGIPFIFQHGLGANRHQPQGLLGSLEGVDLISMDCPGHGEAPLPKDITPSFTYYADLVIDLMNHLKLEKAIFGGISMGAGISINIALRYPEKVQALVLHRPAWLAEFNPPTLLVVKEAAKLIGTKNGLERFEQRADVQQFKRDLPAAAQSALGVFSPLQREEIPLVLESMVGDSPFQHMSELANIQVPCLIMGNEDDPLHPFGMAEQLSKEIRHSQLVKVISRYIDDTSHRQTVTQTISTFIRTL